jgi:hypothetical protein
MSLNPNDILREAAAVFAEHDKHDRELQRLDAELRQLCGQFGEATRRFGYAPIHLRRAVEARYGEIAA